MSDFITRPASIFSNTLAVIPKSASTVGGRAGQWTTVLSADIFCIALCSESIRQASGAEYMYRCLTTRSFCNEHHSFLDLLPSCQDSLPWFVDTDVRLHKLFLHFTRIYGGTPRACVL